jgi:hypothetical protein
VLSSSNATRTRCAFVAPAAAARRALTPRGAQENLCLYGRPDGTWRVELPAEEVPPELPEPALGVNFARDGMAVRARARARARA